MTQQQPEQTDFAYQELKKLSVMLRPKRKFRPPTPAKVLTVKCRRKTCGYVFISNQVSKRCPNCNCSLNIERDKFSAIAEIQRQSNAERRGRR